MDVDFYFDPSCPWTWMTSRWLVEVAGQTDTSITWRTFSLQMLDEGQEIPPELLALEPDLPAHQALGGHALRLMESVRGAGRNNDVGAFYREYGTRVHVEHRSPERSLLEEAAKAAGVEDHLAAADDAGWDASVRASLEEGVSRAGPDVGSPILALDGNARGAFGPIVSPPPTGDDAMRLWEAVVTLHSLPSFLEIKRGRTEPPAVSGEPAGNRGPARGSGPQRDL